MTRRVAAAAVALAAVAALVVVLLVLPAGKAPRPPRPFAARTAFTPAVHLFADDTTATIEVVGDRRRLDPDGARLQVSFAPYDVVAHTKRSTVTNGVVDLRYTFVLRCVVQGCLPKELPTLGSTSVLSVGSHNAHGSRRTFTFAPARLAFTDPRSGKRTTRAVRLPPLQSVSRLSDAVSYGTFPFRIDPAPLPALTYGIPPGLLVGLLVAAIVLLLCVPAAFAARRLRARRPRRELTPLERARLLVRRARNPEELRSALELLADATNGDVAERARRLAWSQAEPSAAEAAALAEAARA